MRTLLHSAARVHALLRQLDFEARHFEAVPSCQQKQPQSNEPSPSVEEKSLKSLLKVF